MNSTYISIAALVGVTGVIGAVLMLVSELRGNSVEERLEVLARKKGQGPGDGTPVTREALVQESVKGLQGMLSAIGERFGNLKQTFVQADMPITIETFMLICLGSAAFPTVIVMFTSINPMFLPLVALCCGAMPLMYVVWRRGRRFKKFAKQLPDSMALIARALRSGHSLASAIKLIVDEMQDPIAKEFNIAYEEQNLGIALEQSLKNVYTRMPNLDFKFFATAVAIQRQSGGDLAEILDKIAHIIRERFKIMGQVQALTGEGRISGIVLMALPVALFFAVWRMNPSYVMLLFTDPLGRQMVAVAIVLQLLGAFTIKKIIAIKV